MEEGTKGSKVESTETRDRAARTLATKAIQHSALVKYFFFFLSNCKAMQAKAEYTQCGQRG